MPRSVNSVAAKIDIAVARGKKMYDKREDLKKKDQEREIRKVVR